MTIGRHSKTEEQIDTLLEGIRKQLQGSALSDRDAFLEEKLDELACILAQSGAQLREKPSAEIVKRHYRAVIETTSDAIIGQTPDGEIFHWNPGAERILGYTADEVQGKPLFMLVPQDRREALSHLLDNVRQDMGTDRIETVFLSKGGERVDVALTASPVADTLGSVGAFSIIARDISHRKLLEQEIRDREEMESYAGATSLLLKLLHQAVSWEEYLRAVVHIIREWSGCQCVGVRVLTEDGAIPYESYAGFSREFWESENYLIVHKDSCICTRTVNGCALPCEEEYLTSNRSFRCGNTFRFLAGLTEEEKTKYRGVCVQVGFKTVVVIPISYEGTIIGAVHLADRAEGKVSNRAVTMLESLAGLIGEAISKFNMQEKLEHSREIRKVTEIEAQHRRDELAHLMRVAIAGEIASSLAHELNQPLSAILSNAQAARRLLALPTPDIEEVRAALDDIVQDDLRAGNVIRKLRSMLKKQDREESVLDINTVVRETMQLIAADARKKKVEVEAELAGQLPETVGDPIQLQQVILNLMLNGFDAMLDVEPKCRKMTVRTSCDPESNTINVAVCDTGPGVDPDKLSRIFESFFTTKAEGIGMGLPISRYLIEAHGGRLWAVKNAGPGMTFCFSMPTGKKHESA